MKVMAVTEMTTRTRCKNFPLKKRSYDSSSVALIKHTVLYFLRNGVMASSRRRTEGTSQPHPTRARATFPPPDAASARVRISLVS